MTEEQTPYTAMPEPAAAPPARPCRKLVFGVVLPLLVLAAGASGALWLMATPPQAKPRPATRHAALVEVTPVAFAAHPTLIAAMGTVRPARQVELKPQVSGRVVTLGDNFIPGGQLRQGELLLRIDETDYQLAVRQLAGEVTKVEAELQLERGNRLVAQKEYELLGEPVSNEEMALMLRQPQLESLRASLEVARARLERARVDLARTEVVAPFNAVVQGRSVNLGSPVTGASTLATLVGTDDYWVELAVPVSQLRWIDIPADGSSSGSAVRIYDEAAWGKDRYRQGRVIRLAAGVEESGRMARLLVQVADPLALKKPAETPRMLIGAYVRAVIAGRELPAAAAVDRALIRDGDTVWVMDGENRLAIRPVKIVFRGEKQVLVTSGLTAGERLVVSDLPAPVEGMPLRLPQQNDAPLASQAPTAESRQ